MLPKVFLFKIVNFTPRVYFPLLFFCFISSTHLLLCSKVLWQKVRKALAIMSNTGLGEHVNFRPGTLYCFELRWALEMGIAPCSTLSIFPNQLKSDFIIKSYLDELLPI